MFIFVLGLEGCGHHGLSHVVKQSMKNASKSINFEVRNLRNVRESIFIGTLKELFQNQTETLSHLYRQVDCLYEDMSYPHGGRRSVASQYNISEEYTYFAEIGKIKVLHLKRNIYNTINSHPTIDGGIINHTKVLSQIQTESIEKELSVLRSLGVHILELEYEKINTDEGIDIITNMLEIDRECVVSAVSKSFKPSKKDYRQLLASETIAQIDEILKSNK